MILLLILVALFSGCNKQVEKIVYKCPQGQVKILENEGTDMQAERCYTPGVYYHDYRPITQKEIK